MGTPKSKAERAREGRWTDLTNQYRRRHRTWIMECLPKMSEVDWKQYEEWVAGFGAPHMGLASHNSRKLRRQLKAAKNTIRIRHGQLPPRQQPQVLLDMMDTHFADAMRYAHEAGAAKWGRATRRK